MTRARARLVLLLLALVAAAPVVPLIARDFSRAGPPLLCVEFAIGDHPTLPTTDAAPPVDLAKRTLELLAPDTPILARMETIRRAVLLAERQPGAGARLQLALQGRALDQEARDRDDALAWFDAGYHLACWAQDDPRAPEAGLAEGAVGYAWVRRAIALARARPELEFAAALLVHPAMHKGTHEIYRRHLQRAAAAAARGSLLEQNLKTHAAAWGESYEDLRSKGERERADGQRR